MSALPLDVIGEVTLNRQLIPGLRVSALAVAVAATAVLGAGVATSATAAVSTAQTPATVAACATSHLRVWYGSPAGAAAGSSYIPLEFSNIGTTTCALYGFPGVSGVTADGVQLGSPARWNHVIAPRTVVLTPGSTAHDILQMVDVFNYPAGTCKPVKADGLRVYPPNQKASATVPFSFWACSKAGPTYLGVDAVNAGVGIPLYTDN